MKPLNVLLWFADSFVSPGSGLQHPLSKSMWAEPFWPPNPRFLSLCSTINWTYSTPCCSDPRDYDCVIADPRIIDPNSDINYPLFIVDLHDDTYLRDTIQYGYVNTLAPKVRGILKHTYNRLAVPEELHKKIIPFNGVIYGDYYSAVLKAIQQNNRSYHARPIDIIFMGSVGSYWKNDIREHRIKTMYAIRDLGFEYVTIAAGSFGSVPKMYNGRSGSLPNGTDHALLLTLSKIVVSPPGYSEISTRDYEAIDAGCHLIKPYPVGVHEPELVSYPYTYDRTCHNCRLGELPFLVSKLINSIPAQDLPPQEDVGEYLHSEILSKIHTP